MKTPKRLLPLVEEGLIDEVISQLMSGKEATVYVVRSGEATRCAKVYKDAKQRSFRQAASYREGRKVKNSRQQRAMEKGSRYGREVQEQAWQNAEVDALFQLANAGVRVPQPFICTDGVLLMELVTDAQGDVAPRLNDVEMTEARALELHALLLNQVVRMLCAGMIHGDLSEYNIPPCSSATSTTSPRISAVSHRSCSTPATARKSGRSTKRARCMSTPC
jgi:RIO kinase 1